MIKGEGRGGGGEGRRENVGILINFVSEGMYIAN